MNIKPTFLIVLFIVSCKVHKTSRITDAYTNCVSSDSVHMDVDSLKYLLRHSHGKPSVGYLAKGTSEIQIEYKNGKTRTLQLLWGNQPTFHFTSGFGKNIWYTFNDTVVVGQWRNYYENVRTKCKDN